ncbi:MAG: dephospho-CoA kinase [Chloroflexi bacterium]|nr:dephospho-CoA kinase [Chloroflexota bacterium]
MYVIGLTGGILSGKSTISEILADLGAVIIDADKLGHEVYKPYTIAWQRVVSEFSNQILTGNREIDRSKLSQIVFNDEKALQRLNAIMHPIMHEIIKEKISELSSKGSKVVVIEAALLIEAKWTDLVDEVWVTVADESFILQRIQSRNGLTEEQARKRINSQLKNSERIKSADYIIRTDTTIESTRKQVENLWKHVPLV